MAIDRPVNVQGPFPFPKELPDRPSITNPVAFIGVAAVAAIGLLGPTFDVGLTGVQGTGSVGSISAVSFDVPLTGVSASGSIGGFFTNVSASNVDRPRVVVGPFPFPKEIPAFGITSQDQTIALTGVSGTGNSGSLINSGPPVDRPPGPYGPFPFFPGGMTGFNARINEVQPNPPPTAIGVQGIGALGSLGSTFVIQLSGVQGTTALGSVGLMARVTGVSATGAVGTLTVASNIVLGGVQSSGQLGTFVIGNDSIASLTGVQAMTLQGSMGAMGGTVTPPAVSTMIVTWNAESQTVTTYGSDSSLITWNAELTTIITWEPS